MQLSWDPIGNWLLVAALAAALMGSLALRPAGGQMTVGRRRTLLILRGLTALLLIAAMLRPTVVYTKTHKQTATIAVLVDRSRSMQVADMAGNRTRWQALEAAIDEAHNVLEDLAEDFQVEFYAVDEALAPLATEGGFTWLDEQPQGDQTALGAALDALLKRVAGKRVAAVLLLSDGAQRALAGNDLPPQTPARQMADLGYPLFTFTFGQARGPEQARDIALTDLALSSPAVFVKNEFAAQATLRAQGFAHQKIPVQLAFEATGGKMETVASGTFDAGGGADPLGVLLKYAPQTPGEYKVTLQTPPQSGELVTTNNQLSTFITVRKGGLNVLYIEGARNRVEKRFVRTALDSSNVIALEYLYLDAQRVAQQPPDLSDRFRPGRYDVYLLGDIDSAAFRGEDLQRLQEAVDAGAGLMMLGGLHSFGPGGYQQTALADVLPVEMDKYERQALGEAPSGDLHLTGEVKMRPSAAGQRHFVTALAPGDEGQRLWASLPPLDGANKFRKTKLRANVLAEDEQGRPLLVAEDVGRGRVMAFAGDSTWRWVLEGYEAAHQRFWRQIVLWLAHKEQDTSGDVWVHLDPRRFAPGRRVEFTAGASAADGQPIAGVQLTAEIAPPQGPARSVRLQSGGGQSSGSFGDTLQAGDYTINVAAKQGDKTLGLARARFLVYEQDLELENPAADPSLMASLSTMTSGEHLPPEQLAQCLEKIRDRPMQLDVRTETKRPLWDTWPFLLILAGLLCSEWALRKRWGLV